MEKIPASKISTGYAYVDTAQSLARLTGRLKDASRVAIDTEADSLHHYFEKVCLIQLSFSGLNYIIDPLGGFSLGEFLKVLSQKELIIQGANYDIRLLKKTFGFRPGAPIFDTMLAAQLLGYEKIGLAALVERFFGISMSKSAQKADWSQRPLSERLLTYASDDTKYLETIADAMTGELQKLDRMAWHRECCERVVKTSILPDKNEEKEAWRVKGSSRLSSQELVFVRELWKWRDEEARKKDCPAFRIFKNEDLIELAQWCVKNPKSQLSQGPVFLKRLAGEKPAQLENVMRSAGLIPQKEWPLPPERMDWAAYDRIDKRKLEPLLAACKSRAKELQIDSSILASRSVLTAVSQHEPGSIEEAIEVSGMMRWQAEVMMPVIHVWRAKLKE
ncbi:MAG TPA: HRDC domain-containing protein [bacterium]|nr:HRDC domain-containing protein [bacterium]